MRAWDKPEIVVQVEKRGRDKDAVAKIEVLTERNEQSDPLEARRSGGSTGFIRISTWPSPSAKFIANVPRKTNLVLRYR